MCRINQTITIMRRNYFNHSLVIDRDFNLNDAQDTLSKFRNTVEGGVLTTSYDNRIVAKTDVSKIYFNFDFANFSKTILAKITTYFTPEKYFLSAKSGIQEIRLVGDELYIDNEIYKKMITIVNSTDKSRALSMNIGLVKMSKYNYIQSYIILTSFTNKHYVSSLPDKIKDFSDNLINFNIDIDYHIKTIEDLKYKNVDIVKLTKSMLYKTDGELIKSMDLKLRALANKLQYMKKYRNDWKILMNITSKNISSELIINSKDIFDTYMVLFKDKDSSIIARESRRILNALEQA